MGIISSDTVYVTDVCGGELRWRSFPDGPTLPFSLIRKDVKALSCKAALVLTGSALEVWF